MLYDEFKKRFGEYFKNDVSLEFPSEKAMQKFFEEIETGRLHAAPYQVFADRLALFIQREMPIFSLQAYLASCLIAYDKAFTRTITKAAEDFEAIAVTYDRPVDDEDAGGGQR